MRLYDYVSLYLPDFKNTDITIWDLMTHTSGLPEGLVGAWTMTRDEIYNGIMNIEKKLKRLEKLGLVIMLRQAKS